MDVHDGVSMYVAVDDDADDDDGDDDGDDFFMFRAWMWWCWGGSQLVHKVL